MLFPTINQSPHRYKLARHLWVLLSQTADWLLLIPSPALNVNFTSFQFCHLEKKALITVLGEQVAFLRCATTIRNTGWYAG